MRTGLIAKKIGMSNMYNAEGEFIPVTLLHIDECEVVQVKTIKTDGYNAVQLAAGSKKRNSKPITAHLKKNNIKTAKAKIAEFRVSENNLLKSGDKLSAAHFVVGQYIDAAATSVGKGFAGVMKRHNYAGLEASHGVSISHRSHGSTGGCQDPGKVIKGKAMAGHLGAETVSVQNLKVVYVNEETNVIGIKGAIPGHKNTFVKIKDSLKKALPSEAVFPAKLIETKAKKESQPKKDSPAQDDLGSESTNQGESK